uniref:Uncharacterized protein n=1 Tax=Arundo donax TaxID=35708 RepID=A0A0A9DNU3_ARUDO
MMNSLKRPGTEAFNPGQGQEQHQLWEPCELKLMLLLLLVTYRSLSRNFAVRIKPPFERLLSFLGVSLFLRECYSIVVAR